ncbi:putative N-acetylmannosamine-6-phosphate 2-epimerase [Folsomia candida]|uniref:Putative N-acetylmannosamine-6-phosphate 2-epimerase n=1 Tax=Folsomia candida TaxID=158441 RepID=A0A226EN76_FOLCA|nr:putative N-acetylmannosamine-6-phosphate 2-epimerase [Folsomia candida]
MSLLYVKFFFLILSLSAALFCHATATSSVAEFEVEVSCPKPEEGRPTPTPCFCPAQKVDTSYGMFHFPKTEATYAGTVTVAPCPYGVIDLGLEPLTPFYVKAVTEAPESGAKRICRLKSNLENGELSNTAVWELDVEPEPKRCRSTSTFDGLRSMNKAVENFEITPYNYKAMWPKFLLVKFWATYPPGDYEAARTLIDALGNLLNSYNRYEEKLDPSAARQCFAMLDDFTKEVPLNPGYRITVPSSHVTVQTAQFPYTSNESAIMNYSAIIDNVQLKFPSDILRMSLMQNVVQPKLRVLAFSEELFILWKHEIEAIPSTTTTRSIVIPEHSTSTTVAPISPDLENNTGLAGRWRVFQVDVLDAAITNLTSEFEYTFQPENEDEIQNYTWKCVFYDEGTHLTSYMYLRLY